MKLQNVVSLYNNNRNNLGCHQDKTGKKIIITKLNGEKINTLQELLSVVKPDFNSYSGSRITISGEVLYNGKKVQAYRHWSHSGNVGLYEGDSNYRIAEIQNANDWFPYVVDGVPQLDELGRPISDCLIEAVML